MPNTPLTIEAMLSIVLEGLPAGSQADAAFSAEGLCIDVTLPTGPDRPDRPDRPIRPEPPAGDFDATLVSRTDYSLTVSLEASGLVKMAVVQSSPPYAWRGEPVDVQPGTLEIQLTDPTDFAKFVCDDEAIDVPTAEEAAAYVPEAGGVDPPDPPDPPNPDGGGGLVAAIAARMGFGLNVERGRPWDQFGLEDPERAQGFADYCRQQSLTHVRLFYPWRPGGGWWEDDFYPMYDTPVGERPTRDQIARLVRCAKNITDNGIIVLFDCCDVMSPDRDCGEFGDLIEPHLRDCAALILEHAIPPDMIIVGPFNEHEASDNRTWNPIRMRYLDVLHDALPGYALCTGGANWKDSAFFLADDYEIWSVEPVLHDVHNYLGGWTDFQALGEALREKHHRLGTQGVYGELGPGDGSQGQAFEVWCETMEASYPHLIDQRVMLWALTDGSWTMNRSYGDWRLYDGSQGWDPLVEPTYRKFAEQALAGGHNLRRARHQIAPATPRPPVRPWGAPPGTTGRSRQEGQGSPPDGVGPSPGT